MDYISICACTDVVIGRGLNGHMVIVCFGLSTIYGNLSYVYHIMLYQWDQSAMGSGRLYKYMLYQWDQSAMGSGRLYKYMFNFKQHT